MKKFMVKLVAVLMLMAGSFVCGTCVKSVNALDDFNSNKTEKEYFKKCAETNRKLYDNAVKYREEEEVTKSNNRVQLKRIINQLQELATESHVYAPEPVLTTQRK